MGAGDCDAMFQAHQFGEHFGAADDRQAVFARVLKFGIVALDRCRDDDHFRVAEILRHGRCGRRRLFPEAQHVSFCESPSLAPL